MSDSEKVDRVLPPLINQTGVMGAVATEKYDPEIVEAYKHDSDWAATEYEYPLRHYSQATAKWGDEETAATLLDRFDIHPSESTITVFGGFTGEFADVLDAAGCDVVFTDPDETWVAAARERGFEAHAMAAEGISSELLSRSTAVASFECYHPFTEPGEKLYTALRFLTVRDGLLFAVSKATDDELRDNGKTQTVLASFAPYVETYGVNRRYRETDGLRIYQFYAPDAETRETLAFDGWVLATLYNEYDSGTTLTHDHTQQIAETLDTSELRVIEALSRLNEVYMGLVPQGMHQYIQFSIDVYGHRYTLNLN